MTNEVIELSKVEVLLQGFAVLAIEDFAGGKESQEHFLGEMTAFGILAQGLGLVDLSSRIHRARADALVGVVTG